MRIRDDTGIRQVIRRVCMREQTVRDEDVARFCFDLGEAGAGCNVRVDGNVGVGRVETFGVGVEGFGYAWGLERLR